MEAIKPANDHSPILEVCHLGKSFGEHEVLRDIDFKTNYGDVICIIGASGSGKSTLLRCINMLETPTSGHIIHNNENIMNKLNKVTSYRAKVGMVFQQFNLFNNMTVLENWMIGVMGIAGVHTDRRSYLTYPITIGPGPSLPNVDTKNIDNSLDIGIAPITRYYLPLNKRNSTAFFLQAALPAVYSKSNNTLRYKYASGVVDEFKYQYDQFSLRGSIGFGLSVQGKFGSFDTHVSNMGWYLSFSKLISKK